MHYGGDIPYFVPFRNALRSITEVSTPLFSLIIHRIISNIVQFAQNFASGFIASVNFFSFLFMKIGQAQPQILSKLGVHYGDEKVLPPFQKPLCLLLKVIYFLSFLLFTNKVMAQ